MSTALAFKRETVRPEKIEAVRKIEEDIQSAQSIVFTDYCGLTVEDMNHLRSDLSAAGVEYKVTKNTLARIAASNQGLDDVHQFLTGPTAIAYGKEDPIAPAKIIAKFAKTNKNMTIKGGILDDKLLSLEEITALADLPSREELLTQLVSVLAGPIRGLVTVLSGNMRNLVNVLDQVRAQKESGESS